MKIKGIKDKKGNIGYYDIETDKHIKGKKTMRQDNRLIESVVLVFLVSLALLWARNAWSAEVYDNERLATAIRKAEGNANYGILKPIKGKNYRKACIQTIDHAKRDWDGSGDFLRFLADRYAPIGAKNDPNNLNTNWYRNTKALYAQDSH